MIWDAGGTLFDTYPAVVAACQAVLHDLGHEASESWLMELFRQTTSHALATVADRFGLDLETFTARYREAYEAVGPELQAPFPYVRKVCAFVCERGGHNFIVTHRVRASLEKLLRAHDLSAYFGDLITAEDPYPRKPDPTSLLALVGRNELEPERCLVVGDRELDILAGKRAGLKTCLFTQETDESQADLVVTGYDQLLHWLQSQVATYR